jgi:glycosyltransferase involved in cell wall biosynthesis
MFGRVFGETYDVVHAFTFFTFSSVIAPFIRANAYFMRTELLDSLNVNCEKAKTGIYKILLFYYRFFYNKVCAFTSTEAAVLENSAFPKTKIIVVPPMIDYSAFSKSSQELHGPLVIGVIARISPEKGIHKLIEIIQNLLKLCGNYKFKLVLAGRIDNKEYGQVVLSRIAQLLGDRFKYIGEVTPPKLFYEQVDIVIVPSLRETGAITTLEAMASGKAVLTNNIYPMKTYIEDCRNGFLYNNPVEAAKRIAILFNGTELLHNLANNAKKDAAKYDLASVCKALEQEYYKAIR